MAKTVLQQEKIDRIEDCIINALNRFGIHEALAEYGLSIEDLEAYMQAVSR